MAFTVLAALWVQGQGMHLAANSIGHLLEEMVGSDASIVTSFYDEVLSHYFWHLDVVGLSGLLLIRQWQSPFAGESASLALLPLAGIIHGLTFFVVVLGLIWGRNKLREQPLLVFFVVSYVVAMVFFVGWAIYGGGLPEFSELGLI